MVTRTVMKFIRELSGGRNNKPSGPISEDTCKPSTPGIAAFRGVINSTQNYTSGGVNIGVWLFEVPTKDFCETLFTGSWKEASTLVLPRSYINFGLILAGYPSGSLAPPSSPQIPFRVFESICAIKEWHFSGRVI